MKEDYFLAVITHLVTCAQHRISILILSPDLIASEITQTHCLYLDLLNSYLHQNSYVSNLSERNSRLLLIVKALHRFLQHIRSAPDFSKRAVWICAVRWFFFARELSQVLVGAAQNSIKSRDVAGQTRRSVRGRLLRREDLTVVCKAGMLLQQLQSGCELE